MKDITYKIKYIENCDMCGATKDNFRVLGKRLNTSQGINPSKKIGITTTVCRCNNCNLIFANPLPVPKNISDHYGIPPENYWTENYFKIDPAYFKGEIEWMKSLIPLEKGMKSLDIGAGIGKQMIALERVGFDTYGFEPSEPFYKRAIEKMGIPQNKLQLTSIEEAEYENDFFDFISFGAVLEHLYFPSDAIQKALKWLKPGGLIHIEVPSSKWLTNRILNKFYQLRGSDYVTNISPMHAPFHLTEFSLDSFAKNAQLNNYKIKDYGYYVCDTYLPKILDPILKPYMQRTNSGMQLCVWLEKSLPSKKV